MAIARARPARRARPAAPAVLADRLQQPVARRSPSPASSTRTSDLSTSATSRSSTVVRPRSRTLAPRRLGRLQGEAAGEDGQAAQQRLLRLGEQVVAPVDGARSVCWRGSAVRPPPVSSRKRSSRRAAICSTREHAHARGRQLERQRDAVQAGADLGRRRARSARSARTPGSAARARSTNRRTASDSRDGAATDGDSARSGTASDGTRQVDLARRCQRLAAGGQDAQPGRPAAAPRRARRRPRPGARSCPAPAAAARCAGARRASSASGRPGCSRTPSDGGDGLRHQRRGRPAGPAPPARRRRRTRRARPARDLERQAGLADAAGAGQRDQPAGSHEQRATSASSRSRPTKLVSWSGRLWGSRMMRGRHPLSTFTIRGANTLADYGGGPRAAPASRDDEVDESVRERPAAIVGRSDAGPPKSPSPP